MGAFVGDGGREGASLAPSFHTRGRRRRGGGGRRRVRIGRNEKGRRWRTWELTRGGAGPRNESHVQFRNYIPRDESIAKERKPQAQVPEPDLPAMGAAKASENTVHLGAEKANWDMKRDIDRKLQQLEPKTREALNDLIRQEEARRLKEGGQAD